MNNYKTVKHDGVAEFTEKKSRFISYVSHVESEEEAIEFVNSIKKRHGDARHNVYAYCVRENNVQRFSDDGEPSGTAGIPVLETIKKQELTDIAVVVTRYFGGILLGGGGLLRAYSHAASIGIESAEPVCMRYSNVYKVSIEYHLLGKIEYEIRKLELQTENPVYDSEVSFTVNVVSEKCQVFEKAITEASGGRASVKKIDECYLTYQIGENNG